jgi:hypothetical protein
MNRHSLFAASILSIIISCSWNNNDIAGGIGHEGEARTIAGAVYYPQSTQKPVTKAAVYLNPRTYLFSGYDVPERESPDAFTDSNGNFKLTVSDTGKYSIEVNDGNRNAVLIACTVADSNKEIRLEPDTLTPTGAIKGFVLLSTLPGQTALVQVYGIKRMATTDSSTGAFTIDDVPRGNYTIRATSTNRTGALFRTKQISVASGATASADTIHLIGFNDETYADWPYSRRLSIDTLLRGANVNTTLTNFPLLVRLRDYNFPFGQAGVKGESIRFANAKGAPLQYEIEEWDTALAIAPDWDSSLMQAAIWVNLDTLHAGHDSQYITMYWGAKGAVNWSSSSDVFKPEYGFTGVWHMHELLPGGALPNIRNATAALLYGQAHNFTSDTTIIEGYLGRSMEFDGDNDYVVISGAPSLISTTMTFEAWVRPWQLPDSLTPTRDGVIVSQKDAFTISFTLDSTVKVLVRGQPGNGDSTILSTPSGPVPYFAHHFHHVAVVCNGAEIICYIDGKPIASVQQTVSAGLGARDIYIGAAEEEKGPSRFFAGTIDEVRIQTVARSAEWIMLSYENQRDNRLHKIGEKM